MLTGLFPKTCFCWNSPLQESQCFALLTEQGAEWLVIIISQQCKLAIMANSLIEKWIRKRSKNVRQSVRVKKKLIDLEFSSRKEHPSGAFFCECHMPWSQWPPDHTLKFTPANTNAPQVNEGARWPSAFRRLRARRTGEGAPSGLWTSPQIHSITDLKK